jgi:hypothetical protein
VKSAPKISPHYFPLRALIQQHGLQTLRLFSVLCGSDYYDSPGIGPSKALPIMQDVFTRCAEHKVAPCYSDDPVFMQILVNCICPRFTPNAASGDVLAGLTKAFQAFEHSKVFNPLTTEFMYARSSPTMVVDTKFLGELPRGEMEFKSQLDFVMCRMDIPVGVIFCIFVFIVCGMCVCVCVACFLFCRSHLFWWRSFTSCHLGC